MTIVKVIEVISEGKSIEDAVQSALTEAIKTLHNIQQINIEHVEAMIEKNKIAKYRVRCKVSFILDANRKD